MWRCKDGNDILFEGVERGLAYEYDKRLVGWLGIDLRRKNRVVGVGLRWGILMCRNWGFLMCR